MKNSSKSERNEILSIWRELGFLSGLKEGGIIEWRCAKSYDLMAKYMLGEEGCKVKCLSDWEVAMFAIIRGCLTRNSSKLTRIIEPGGIVSLLGEKTIREFLLYGINGGSDGWKCGLSKHQEYLAGCFFRYLELKELLDRPIIEIFSIMSREEVNKLDLVFGCDYEGMVCSLFSDYYCWWCKSGK